MTQNKKQKKLTKNEKPLSKSGPLKTRYNACYNPKDKFTHIM